jgi:hypothetical protein
VISVRLAFCRSEIVVLVIFHGAGLADNYSEDQDNFTAVIRSNSRPRALANNCGKSAFLSYFRVLPVVSYHCSTAFFPMKRKQKSG